jgi:hypothetical protein
MTLWKGLNILYRYKRVLLEQWLTERAPVRRRGEKERIIYTGKFIILLQPSFHVMYSYEDMYI